MKLQTGQIAPDFTLVNQNGEQLKLSDYRTKKWVVLYFYPKDNTYGCTREACSFRDNYQDFQDLGAEVIGVSSDDMKSHKAFIAKNKLPFQLLSDADGKLRKLYDVPKTLGVLPGRVTFIIDRQGVIRHIFNALLGFNKHVGAALQTIKSD